MIWIENPDFIPNRKFLNWAGRSPIEHFVAFVANPYPLQFFLHTGNVVSMLSIEDASMTERDITEADVIKSCFIDGDVLKIKGVRDSQDRMVIILIS